MSGPAWVPASHYTQQVSFAPSVDMSSAAVTLASSTVSAGLCDAGDFLIEMRFTTSQDFVAAYATNDVYFFSAHTPDGLLSLRYHDVTNVTGNFTLQVRGSDVTMHDAGSNYNCLEWQSGDDIVLFAWYKPSTGKTGFLFAVNGVITTGDPGGGGGVHNYVVGSTTGGALSQPTDFYLGSNLGASAFLKASCSRAWFHRAGTSELNLPVSIVHLGDSIGVCVGLVTPIASQIRSASEYAGHPYIVTTAFSGQTIPQQTSAIQVSRYFGDQGVRAVLYEAGVNDVTGGRTEVQMVADYQAQVNACRAAWPNAKHIAVALTPAGAWTSGQKAIRNAFNLDLQGLGTNNVTGLDACVTSHNPILDDGTGAMKPQYTIDGLHPINPGKVVIGAAIRSVLNTFGLGLG